MNSPSPISSLDPAYAETYDRRILIVDDDEPIRSVFADSLSESYSCQTAANALEALEYLAQEPFALVITDVHMPGLGGIGLLRRINERYAGIAHDLNNPAGFIYSNMGLLKEYLDRLERCLAVYDEISLPSPAAERVEAIKREIRYDNILSDLGSMVADCYTGAERIRDVVENLRLFSRLDEAELKAVDLHEGIESTIRLVSVYYSSGRITLRREYGELPAVNCYAAQLNQVWMNLLVNAAQAIGAAEGQVRISTPCHGHMVITAISDTA